MQQEVQSNSKVYTFFNRGIWFLSQFLISCSIAPHVASLWDRRTVAKKEKLIKVILFKEQL